MQFGAQEIQSACKIGLKNEKEKKTWKIKYQYLNQKLTSENNSYIN